MNADTFQRLQGLRMENDVARFNQQAMRPRFDALRTRHEDGTAPAAVSAFQLFQTPPAVAARLVELLAPSEGARILEPSAGLGRILDALAPRKPSEVVAVEISPDCAGVLFKQDRHRLRILQRDFLTVEPSAVGLFDSVAMNPPFHLRDDIRHIRHALRFLKPGGRLAAICMDTPHRSAALRHLCDTWQPLPSGTFRAEGTNTACVLLTITTPTSPTQH